MRNFIKYNPEFNALSERERRALAKAAVSTRAFVKSSQNISKVNYATRDAHAKTYATTLGILEINDDIPVELRDIFDQKEYEVMVRFSNANLMISKSKKNVPAYGLSLKIKDVGANDANFPMANFPLFPTNEPIAFLDFFNSLNTFLVTKADNFLVAVMDIPALLINSLKLTADALSRDLLIEAMKFVRRRKNFPLSMNFYGIGCYRIGNHMMKINVDPVNIPVDFAAGEAQTDSIPEYLKEHETSFKVVVQLCDNLHKQPINNLQKKWRNAPTYELGTIHLPAGNLLNSDAPEIENLTFNPFENSEKLQPVGKIQTMRREIYKASIETRNQLNKNDL